MHFGSEAQGQGIGGIGQAGEHDEAVADIDIERQNARQIAMGCRQHHAGDRQQHPDDLDRLGPHAEDDEIGTQDQHGQRALLDRRIDRRRRL
ncbi:hypothetical protein D3C87_1567220 [compost metagenome]